MSSKKHLVSSKNYCKGFSLIELMAAIGILVILSVTALTIVSQSLKSTAVTEVRRQIDNNTKFLNDRLARFLRESEITQIGSFNRSGCLSSAYHQVTGTTANVRSLDGGTTLLYLIDATSQIASQSGGSTLPVNPTNLLISNLSFQWSCGLGIEDKVRVSYQASMAQSGMETTSQLGPYNYSFDVVLRNTGKL